MELTLTIKKMMHLKLKRELSKVEQLLEAGLDLYADFYRNSTDKDVINTEAYRLINHIRETTEKPFGWDKQWIDYYDRRKVRQ